MRYTVEMASLRPIFMKLGMYIMPYEAASDGMTYIASFMTIS
jgi:hypothetical protein